MPEEGSNQKGIVREGSARGGKRRGELPGGEVSGHYPKVMTLCSISCVEYMMRLTPYHTYLESKIVSHLKLT